MKFFGRIGFEETKETLPGVWEADLVFRNYIGNVTRNQRRWETQKDTINDNLNISNEISVLADDYMLENLGTMKCVEFGGCLWKISWINVQRPRVILTLSERYNEEASDV